jgi:transcriptional regulator with XRE-family HTH domain
VPRPNPLRAMQSEDNLARRVAYERERRGWTYEGTARRMTDVGCSVQGSAIYKIEKGTPRRRISVDELVAFADIFDVDTSDLLIPVELMAEQEALELMAELEAKFRVLSASAQGYYAAIERIFQLANSLDKEHAQRVVGVLWQRMADIMTHTKNANQEVESLFFKFYCAAKDVVRDRDLDAGAFKQEAPNGQHSEAP